MKRSKIEKIGAYIFSLGMLLAIPMGLILSLNEPDLSVLKVLVHTLLYVWAWEVAVFIIVIIIEIAVAIIKNKK